MHVHAARTRIYGVSHAQTEVLQSAVEQMKRDKRLAEQMEKCVYDRDLHELELASSSSGRRDHTMEHIIERRFAYVIKSPGPLIHVLLHSPPKG